MKDVSLVATQAYNMAAGPAKEHYFNTLILSCIPFGSHCYFLNRHKPVYNGS